ncbi:MAG TPA: ABC transporter ATP-binding protein [Acidimicrobiales bacterium]|jgi:ABC-type nitrate/sulfonate/bicarbonate transport system ATPase subunit|nr:ABC transporter ATP-binding protein [Acidimicrobiales bacterium]
MTTQVTTATTNGAEAEAAAGGAAGTSPAGTDHKLTIRELVKVFPGGRKSDDVVALGGVDVHVDAGELVSLVGTSGCGKSTLLRIAAGLEQATSGEVLVDGEPVIGPGPDRGMIFQNYSLFPWLNVSQNIAFGLGIAGMGRAQRRERVDELLAIMGLTEHSRRLPKELSGGMRQRVAIARALAPEPDVLLLDEPFGALDAQTRLSMHEFLRSVWRRTGATILLVTHDVDEAVYLSSRVYVLHAHPGRIVEQIAMPFEPGLGPAVKRSPQFLDVRDEIHDLLMEA